MPTEESSSETGNTVWHSAALTDRGARRKINEDAILARPEARCWVVADGMGGHEAGDVASQMVTSALQTITQKPHLSEYVDLLEDTLETVNRRIRDHSATMFGGRTMGATVVTLVANDSMGVCLWAGDSRLYRKRGSQIEQLSSDHSEVQELVDRGVLSPEEAENHPNSNVITRAVGGAPNLFLDVALFDVQPGDVFMLCSDGLYNEVGTQEIGQSLDRDVNASAERLMNLALERGARDNVSVIVVHRQ